MDPPVPKGPENPTSLPLLNLFVDVVNDKKVSITLKTLETIITNELGINIEDVPQTLLKILPYMLVSYIKSWPGWAKKDEYLEGTLKLDEWYIRFHQYVTFKIIFLIQKAYGKALNEMGMGKVDKESQCEKEDQRSFSPFSLRIGAPPKLLNTVLFASDGGNVVMKMHGAMVWSDYFTIEHLVNWPFLEVHFQSDFLEFRRSLQPKFVRYLARPDEPPWKGEEEPTTIICPDVEHLIPIVFMKHYLTSYVRALSDQILESDKMVEIKVLLTELYRDFSEVSSVSEQITDTASITFNIGGCTFLRNKKIVHNSTSKGVGFIEVITPKCTTKMLKIETGRDLNGQLPSVVNFSFFGRTPSEISHHPSISYSCTYCKKRYGGRVSLNAILKHYKEEHNMEHQVICFDCKRELNVLALSTSRWYHNCANKRAPSSDTLT